MSPPLISATSLNFGTQTVGAASVAQQVTLTNSAGSALNLSAIAIGGPDNADFAQTNTCGASLAANASCTIAVKFMPAQFGPRNASLFVGGNTGAGPLAVQLTGAGAGTGPAPSIQALADAWNFTPPAPRPDSG